MELLSKLIPKLRNDFFHRTYLMYLAFLPLCFQMRELADALCPEIQRRKRGQQDMTVSRIKQKNP
jgi:hypothetical protein